MNKTTLIAAAVLVIGAPIAYRIYWEGLISDLVVRFPHLDKKVIRKAYREMMKSALTNPNFETDGLTDEQMDALFLDIVRKQTASK